jgi:hypothetical protein
MFSTRRSEGRRKEMTHLCTVVTEPFLILAPRKAQLPLEPSRHERPPSLASPSPYTSLHPRLSHPSCSPPDLPLPSSPPRRSLLSCRVRRPFAPRLPYDLAGCFADSPPLLPLLASFVCTVNTPTLPVFCQPTRTFSFALCRWMPSTGDGRNAR